MSQFRTGDLYVHDFHGHSGQGYGYTRHNLRVVFNNRDIVVDVLFDAPSLTLVSIGDHCQGSASPAATPPPAAPSPAPAPALTE